MLKRAIAVCVTAAATIAAASGCEVTHINWGNHFYATGQGCLHGTATVSNGTGVGANGIQVQVDKTLYGDLNQDGVLDVAVFLSCSAAPTGANGTGTEIQIFTRDGKPVARLEQPDRYGSGNPFGSHFNPNNVGIQNGALYTGAYGWAPGDCHACASRYDVYRWDWNGSGFSPVDVSSRPI